MIRVKAGKVAAMSSLLSPWEVWHQMCLLFSKATCIFKSAFGMFFQIGCLDGIWAAGGLKISVFGLFEHLVSKWVSAVVPGKA